MTQQLNIEDDDA